MPKPFNSETAREAQKKSARSRKGAQYYATKIQEKFIGSRTLQQSIDLCIKYENRCMKKLARGEELTDNEIKALAVVQKRISQLMDKTIATKFESDNKHEITDTINFYIVQPDNDGKRDND